MGSQFSLPVAVDGRENVVEVLGVTRIPTPNLYPRGGNNPSGVRTPTGPQRIRREPKLHLLPDHC